MLRLHQNVFRMNYAKVLCTKFSKKLFLLHFDRLKCIKMHQKVSKCIKLYEEWIILMFCAWNSNLKNSIFFWSKSAHFFLSAQNASICIRIHQNVCRTNCAKVLCTKLSKNWFLLNFKGPKLTKYICLFMVVHPVELEFRWL